MIPKSLTAPHISGLALEVLDFYNIVKTQWVYVGGMGGVSKVGLRYESIIAVADKVGFKLTKTKFALLRILENIVIEKEQEGDKNVS